MPKHQEFDTRPLADGLHDLAGQAADAPGLFDAVAAGARRRSARVRASGAVLAVGGVLGIAAGVAAWPSGPGSQTPSLASKGPVAHVECPSTPPVSKGSPYAEPPAHLPVGIPAAATLCIYKITDNGITARQEVITGSALKALTDDLKHAKSAASALCTAERINPTHELVMQYPGGYLQTLVIDLSGCGTVGNGNWAVLLPTELRQLIRS